MAFGSGDFAEFDTTDIADIASDVTDIKTYLSGEGIQLKFDFSKTGNVEEDQYSFFAVYVNDVENGAIASANIDITSIAVDLSKSTGGAAFSNVGITQPTFSKANGIISVNYKFKAAEWELGDSYKLTVSGIAVTIGSDTMAVPGHSWVASITEQVNIESKIDTIDGIVDGIQTDLNAIRIRKPAPSAVSARVAALAFSNVAGDKDFPSVVFPANFIPSTATVFAAYLMILFGGRKNSSVAENKVNAAAKTIRIKLSTGAWGTDDIVAMTLAINTWVTDASSRDSGGILVGSTNLSSVLTNPATINGATVNVRSEETNAGEGITVTGASLTVYDIDSFIIVEYSL